MAEYDQRDRRTVYCIPLGQLSDPDFGLLKPVLERTPSGLMPVDKSVYLNNGKIHVTQGYHKVIGPTDNDKFFRVEATVSLKWNPETDHDGISKYVTYNKNIEAAKYLEISQVFKSSYPDSSSINSLTCLSSRKPLDGFFIIAENDQNVRVLIGPLDVVKDSIKILDTQTYSFQYKPVDRPLGGGFGSMNKVPHSAMIFEIDLIPEGALLDIDGDHYLVNHQELLPFNTSTLIDLSSDDNIIKWAQKNLRVSKAASQEELLTLKNLVDKIPEDDIDLPSKIIEERRARLKSIPEKLQKMDGLGEIFSDFINSEEGQKVLKNHIDANRTSLLEKYHFSELEKVREKTLREIEDSTEQKRVELNSINVKISEVSKNLESLQSTEFSQELKQEKDDLEKIRKERAIIFSIGELETQKTILEQDLSDLRIKQSKAKMFLDELQSNINKSQDTHKLKLIELKMELEALSGNVISEEDLIANIREDLAESEDLPILNINESRINLIKNIRASFHRKGRVSEFNDIATILTCMMQNLILTLAGKPGSGKTSTVTELGQSLGLVSRNKLVHIQVQRGWTSDRDIIGFQNRLTSIYDPDRFGLYKLINALQKDGNQLTIALLDEANLSPIEHYWSGFMGACDNSQSFSTQGKKLDLPNGLRFIATVNYDRTTEPLSARFLDRSPVISLESKKLGFLDDGQIINDLGITEYYYSFNYLNKLFGKSDDPKFTEDEARILQDIIEGHRFITLEHRKVKSIRQFTNTLRDVLEDSDAVRLKALDYAVLIFILPLISGQGREYGQSVIALNQFLEQQGLSASAYKVKQIVELSRFDAYSYFS
jgi:hypothetical protein